MQKKKEMKTMLNKIIEELDLNLKQTLINLNYKKADIEKQLQPHEWVAKLVEDQLKQNKTYYNFGENFENKELKNKSRNVTVRKRKLLPLNSEDRLKDLPSIYTKIPGDRTKKIESTKEIFSNIIKRILSESYKKFKIDYDQLNNIDISEIKSNDDEFRN